MKIEDDEMEQLITIKMKQKANIMMKINTKNTQLKFTF